MDDVSYSAHISNGKSAINSKSRLSGVAKHNLRKYRSKEYDRDNIVLLFGSTNLLQDVKKVYHDTFTEALEQYNQKQTRADRRIEDYFEHVSDKNQDMAVEIIFQCGDKDFLENIFIDTDNEKEYKENICKVYDTLLEQLQKEMPDFRVANAVVHFDEASPHMHVVGVPIGRGFKRGLETKRLEMVAENLDEKQDMLYDTSLRLEQAEKEVTEAENICLTLKRRLPGQRKI